MYPAVNNIQPTVNNIQQHVTSDNNIQHTVTDG